MRRSARQRRFGGVPIEEAPVWMLAVLTVLLWLVAFPALVGLLAGFGRWHGARLGVALVAFALALALVVGMATRRPWKRAPVTTLEDPRPPLVRLSSWIVTALLLPNVLLGVLVLSRPHGELGYRQVVGLSLLISTVHAAVAFLDRGRRRGEL